MVGMTVPGNIIIKNGGRLVSSGDMSWNHDEIYQEGADVIIDAGEVLVPGDVIVGGVIEISGSGDAVVDPSRFNNN